MGYLHINNLYKDQKILQFRTCYALEKVHGTSANISWRDGAVHFHSGGESYERFKGLFNQEQLVSAFKDLGHERVTVYGEAYGGKQQGMSATYGKELRFIVFDVQIDQMWISVPQAHDVAQKLSLEFVPYAEGPCTVEWLNSQRDLDSEVAVRRGMGAGHIREGVVIRPPYEVTLNDGHRVMAKHKRDEFRETATPRVVDPTQQKILDAADAIADEWVTTTRLAHVLDKIPAPHDISITPKVIRAMIEDVFREAEGEIIPSKETEKAIGKRAAKLFHQQVKKI